MCVCVEDNAGLKCGASYMLVKVSRFSKGITTVGIWSGREEANPGRGQGIWGLKGGYRRALLREGGSSEGWGGEEGATG